VLLAEVIAALDPKPGEVMIDGTFGAGGYSRAILERGARVVAFDRDPAVKPWAELLEEDFRGKLQLQNRRFSEMVEGFADSGHEACHGVTLDIDGSSMQLDQAARGFSFMRDGPL